MKKGLRIFCLYLLGTSIMAIQSCELKEIDRQTQEQVSTCAIDSISASEGETMISEAQVYIDEVNEMILSDSALIPYGAKIPICELQEILNDLGTTPDVWAMMAMKGGKLEIVFQGLDDSTNTYKYYDFTKPCPVTCPE